VTLRDNNAEPHPMQEDQKLELIDGMGKHLARMIEPAPRLLSAQCAPGRHCAHHGAGPFFCCRCAAQFVAVQ
jgi:hypothetical protein